MNVVLVSSTSQSKIEGTKKAFEFYGIECIVRGIEVPSFVSDRPVDEEVVRGAINRNENLKRYCHENNIPYNYLVSIEGGFPVRYGIYMIETFAYIEDEHGFISRGFSRSYELGKVLHKYASDGNSINKLIEENTGVSNNKQRLGIMGTLTDGKIPREEDNFDAVSAGLVSMIYRNNYDIYNGLILKKSGQEKK